jgi:hypothetical protein
MAPLRWRFATFLVACAFAMPFRLNSQENKVTVETFEQASRTKGEVLAEGHNTLPIGPWKIKTYRLERVWITKPKPFWRDKNGTIFNQVFRLVISADNLDSRRTVWLGDVPYPAVPIAQGEIGTVMLGGEQTKFEDGAQISVSNSGCGPPDPSETILPERFRVPQELRRTQTQSKIKVTIQLTQKRALLIADGLHGLSIGNEPLKLRLGRTHPHYTGDVHWELNTMKALAHFSVPIEDFWRLPDGISMFAGYGCPAQWYLGALDKTSATESSKEQ